MPPRAPHQLGVCLRRPLEVHPPQRPAPASHRRISLHGAKLHSMLRKRLLAPGSSKAAALIAAHVQIDAIRIRLPETNKFQFNLLIKMSPPTSVSIVSDVRHFAVNLEIRGRPLYPQRSWRLAPRLRRRQVAARHGSANYGSLRLIAGAAIAVLHAGRSCTCDRERCDQYKRLPGYHPPLRSTPSNITKAKPASPQNRFAETPSPQFSPSAPAQ